MKRLEIIELRTADSNSELLKSKLQELINEVETETKEQSIKSYSHVTIDTDFSIHLIHESETLEPFGSRLGLRITSALREFGLVHHSVWIEMHGK